MSDENSNEPDPGNQQSGPGNPYQYPIWPRRIPGRATGTSLGVKFFLLGLLAVILCIPLFMVWGLVKEREANYRQATAEIGRQWGASQTINGPFLAVPVVYQWIEQKNGESVTRRESREVLIAPDRLEIDGNVETSTRTRGIHEAIVYQSQAKLLADFSPPDLRSFSSQIINVDWPRARLVLSLSDPKGIVDIAVRQDGVRLAEIEPGLGITGTIGAHHSSSGLHIPLKLGQWSDRQTNGPNSAVSTTAFEMDLKFQGSQSISFVPVGADSEVGLDSTWPHPSFSGTFLPSDRTISDNGFTAQWTISKLARSIPQIAFLNDNSFNPYQASSFGVRFYQPVDFYRLVDRAVKYGVLFIGMAFLIIFSLEVVSKGRMHAVHYTMSGLMVIMFYVLLLALAEMIGFSLAYGVAAGATGAVLAGFVASIFKGKRASLGAVAGFSLLYGLLYMVLRLEDAALLAGAVTGFIILTAVMFATRKVDWSVRNTADQGAST